MQQASALNLETIRHEDEIILVNKSVKPIKGDYFYNTIDCEVYGPAEGHEILHTSDEKYDFKVISSTKKYEGLPLLVIEDEVEKLANQAEIEEYKDNDPYDQFYAGGDFYEGFKQGYNKARQTYKFTEEDLRKAYREGAGYIQEVFYDNRVGYGDGRTIRGMKEEEFIQSITKKELWIEVEEKHFRTVKNNEGQLIDHQFTIEPKITEGKIKAVWK